MGIISALLNTNDMFNKFTIVGVLQAPPEKKVASNGSPYVEAAFTTDPYTDTAKHRFHTSSKQEDVFVSFYRKECIDAVLAASPNDLLIIEGKLHGYTIRSRSGEIYHNTTCIGESLSCLGEAVNGGLLNTCSTNSNHDFYPSNIRWTNSDWNNESAPQDSPGEEYSSDKYPGMLPF